MSGAAIRYAMGRAWAMDEGVLRSLVAVLDRHDSGDRATGDEIGQIVAARDRRRSERAISIDLGDDDDNEKPDPLSYTMSGSVAVLPIDGVISKYSALINGASQPAGVATDEIVSAIAAAADDPKVGSLLLLMDSPGGTVSGVTDAVAAVRAASAIKPVCCFVNDLAASAAYWIASACDEVWSTPVGTAGSIGVYRVVDDTSAAAQKAGVVRTVVRTGDRKGLAVDGAAVTPENLAALREEMDGTFRAFLADVQAGREMEPGALMAIADGRCLVGAAAVSAGLVDGLCSLPQMLARMNQATVSSQGYNRRGASALSRQENRMAAAEIHPDPIPAPAPAPAPRAAVATVAELRAEFTGRSEFVLACLEEERTLTEARAAFALVLMAENSALRARAEKAESVAGSGVRAAAASAATGPEFAGDRAGEPKTWADAVALVEQDMARDGYAACDKRLKLGGDIPERARRAARANEGARIARERFPDLNEAHFSTEWNGRGMGVRKAAV